MKIQVIKFGDSVIVNGRVWVFYDASKTDRGMYTDTADRVKVFMETHPTGQVVIGLGGVECPTKSLEEV